MASLRAGIRPPHGARTPATHLSGQVLQDGCRVDGGGGAHTSVARRAVLQVPVDTSDGELNGGVGGEGGGKPRYKQRAKMKTFRNEASSTHLESCPRGTGHGFGLRLSRVFACFASSLEKAPEDAQIG